MPSSLPYSSSTTSFGWWSNTKGLITFTMIASIAFIWYVNVFLLMEQQWSSTTTPTTTTPTTMTTNTISWKERREPSSSSASCSDPAVQFLTIASPQEQLLVEQPQQPQKQQQPSTTTAANDHHATLLLRSDSQQPQQQQQQRLPPPRTPKILCCIVTHQDNHNTSAQAIWDTWGQKCDHLIMSSNANDPSIHAIDMKARPGYEQLWHKLELSLQYLHTNYYNPPHHHGDGGDGGGDNGKNGEEYSSSSSSMSSLSSFDWILKADDDTYVIMENLKAFLAQQTNHGLIPQVYNTVTNTWEDAPMVYGRTMPYPKLRAFFEWENWFTNPHNHYFGDVIREQFNIDTTTLLYPHGGPGYIMNWKYLQVLLAAFTTDPPQERVRGKMPDDMASAITMLHRGILPTSTRDDASDGGGGSDSGSDSSGSGLERSHPEPPQVMYENPSWLKVAQVNLQNTGHGNKCCAPSSISYHHLDHEAIRQLHYQLYTCPRRRRRRSD